MSDAEVLRPTWRARGLPRRLRSDEWLARQAGRGDADAFAVLYERHHRPLYRYCRSIVGDPDDAADALQSAMTRALAAISGRDERAPVVAWLFRIAHNESISVVRGRRRVEPLEPAARIGPDVVVDAERRDRLAQLVADLQALPERQRAALLMREVSGLGHADIAAALEVGEGAVKQTIYEARTALHEFAAGREMACASVRRQLSDGDGRTARSRRLRAHLRSCGACRAFREELRSRRSELAAVAPVGVTAAAVLESVIGGGGAAGGGLLAGLLGGSGISKTVVVGAATVTAGASAVTLTAVAPDVPRPEPAAPVHEARAREPRKPSELPPVAAAPDEPEDRPEAGPERSAPPADARRVVVVRHDVAPERRSRSQRQPSTPVDDEDRRAELEEDERPEATVPEAGGSRPESGSDDELDEPEERDDEELVPVSKAEAPAPDDDADDAPDDD